MAISVEFWHILVDFTITFHKLFPNHVIMSANLENFLVSPGFKLNVRKCAKFQIVSLKALRVMD